MAFHRADEISTQISLGHEKMYLIYNLFTVKPAHGISDVREKTNQKKKNKENCAIRLPWKFGAKNLDIF